MFLDWNKLKEHLKTIELYELATKTGGANGEAAGGTQLQAVDAKACSLLIHTFVSVDGRAAAAPFAVARGLIILIYIAMRLFQSLDASRFAPREYSHWGMFRGPAVRLEILAIRPLIVHLL
jgi:hypothetical protein